MNYKYSVQNAIGFRHGTYNIDGRRQFAPTGLGAIRRLPRVEPSCERLQKRPREKYLAGAFLHMRLLGEGPAQLDGLLVGGHQVLLGGGYAVFKAFLEAFLRAEAGLGKELAQDDDIGQAL
mgnify:CR=1 FL=1